MKSIVYRLSSGLNNSNPRLMVLLTLLSCAFLIDVSVAQWIIMPPSIMVMLILLSIQYINYRFWWASLFTVCLFFLMLGPDFPRLANHGNLGVLICIVIGAVFIKKLFTNKGLHPDTITLSFRYSLVAIYFIAGFHKLNSGFFNLSGSCSLHVSHYFNAYIFGNDFTPSAFAIRFYQIVTIVIEMIVPFGILFYQTRRVAVIILVVFHFYLSFCGFSNFSAFAGFLIAGCILDLKTTYVSKNLSKSLKAYVFIVVLSSLAAYMLRRLEIGSRQSMLIWNGILFNIGWIYFFYILIKEEQGLKTIYKASVIPYLFVIFITLWGVQGYLGLSNTATLTMFSNLVTEKSRSNHYLINTQKTKLWDFEEDYINVIKLPENCDWGKHYKIENYDLPLIEFKKIAAYWVKTKKAKLSCTIRYKDKIIYIDDLAKSDFSKPQWRHKFLYYRRIPKKGVNQCQW